MSRRAAPRHKYTQDERARIEGMISALEGAREHLDPRHGLCNALHNWARIDRSTRDQSYTDARQLVTRAIEPCVWYDDWVRRHHPRVLWQSTQVMLSLRNQWLDRLITDCKAAL